MSSFESLGNFYGCALVCISKVISFNDWKSHSCCLSLNKFWKNTYHRYFGSMSNKDIVKTDLILYFSPDTKNVDVQFCMNSLLAHKLCVIFGVEGDYSLILPHLPKFKNLTRLLLLDNSRIQTIEQTAVEQNQNESMEQKENKSMEQKENKSMEQKENKSMEQNNESKEQNNESKSMEQNNSETNVIQQPILPFLETWKPLFSKLKSLTVTAGLGLSSEKVALFSSFDSLVEFSVANCTIHDDTFDPLITLLHKVSEWNTVQTLILQSVDLELELDPRIETLYQMFDNFAPTLTNLDFRHCDNFPFLVDYSQFAEYNLLKSLHYLVIHDSIEIDTVRDLSLLKSCLTCLDLTGHVWQSADNQMILREISTSLPLLVTLKCVLPMYEYQDNQTKLVQDLQDFKNLKHLHLMNLLFIQESDYEHRDTVVESLVAKLRVLNLNVFEYNWRYDEYNVGIGPYVVKF